MQAIIINYTTNIKRTRAEHLVKKTQKIKGKCARKKIK